VYEWCSDWYDSGAYNRYKTGDLKAPATGNMRVFRGGSWFNNGTVRFRTTGRSKGYPDHRHSDFGFRSTMAL
jgi:formylglycine-generating enzyme required for sulfatase activity